MSIQQISERETALTDMLRKTGEALDAVRAERDALSDALSYPSIQAIKADAEQYRRLRDSGVELPIWTLLHRQWPDSYWYGEIYGYTADQLRDYGDRRATAERERAAKVCDLAATQCGETLKGQLGLSEKLVARGAQVQAEKLAASIIQLAGKP